MKLWQLEDNTETYGEFANGWLIVSDDCEDEIAGPFKTQSEAEKALAKLSEFEA